MNKTKFIALLLVTAIIVGICPYVPRKSKAATASATLHNLGALGSISVGSKTKTGNWWKIFVGGNEVFCLNMGYTCHSGDVYASSTKTFSSTDDGKDKLRALTGYWYEKTRKRNGKAYVFAQALFWAIEEGDTSESKLKSVLKKMKSNTGYFSGKTADQLYDEIYEKEGKIEVDVRIWKYRGSGTHRQELLEVVATEDKNFNPKHLHKRDTYRQRITLDKIDKDKKPLVGVKFQLSVENIDELYFFRANGLGSPESGDVDEDIDHFEMVVETDSNGRIAFRFNYEIQTKEFYYYTDSELSQMTASDRKDEKEKLDEEGYEYDATLTKAGAEAMAQEELNRMLSQIKNKYILKEIGSSDKNIFINPDYTKGQTIILGPDNSWTKQSDGQWPETSSETYADFPAAYHMFVENDYKKISVHVKKEDSYSSDHEAHGNAELDGAEFMIFEDKDCSKGVTAYDEKGNSIPDPVYRVENGSFETYYLRCGKTYYLREIRAPQGYKRKDEVIEIKADGSTYELEYTAKAQSITVKEQPILGKVAIQKYIADDTAGPIQSEEGAVFQIYLKERGEYDKSDDYERDTITTDSSGYACTKDLYYGTYLVHQVSSGKNDTEKVSDFEVEIAQERSEPYLYTINNPIFKAYLRVIKKDGTTKQDVLKAGTSYQIYRINPTTGEETLVIQNYRDGHGVQNLDCFETDETGQIMTVEPLVSGTYRIYEKTSAEGYHRVSSYIEIDIDSSSENTKSYEDSNGRTYTVVSADYVNEETYGKLKIKKKGEQLKGFENGNFTYEETDLTGVVLEIYAEEAIATQDNQGTNWFEKNDLVATVTTGEGVVFDKDCGGICKWKMDEENLIEISLPLGEYRVVEKETKDGYILADKNWKLSFQWENQEEEYVLNSTENTDYEGTLTIQNERAKTNVSLNKVDSESEKPVRQAKFVLYSRNDIYNAEGEKIFLADHPIGTVFTDEYGKADFDYNLPLKSEKNSGDYYIRELSAPDGYYCIKDEIPVHLEYKDDSTKVISSSHTVKEKQTTVEIDKISVGGGEEIPGCNLEISDGRGNVIVSWISGEKESVRFSDHVSEWGYQNLVAKFDEKGAVHIGGLFHDVDYRLTETRPADGYVTADSIVFRITEEGQNLVKMVDEKTVVEFRKMASDTGKLLQGAEIEVYDSKGKIINGFTTSKSLPVIIKGLLKVGESYTFREKNAPQNYQKAADITYRVLDTPDKQTVSMVDEKFVKTKDEKTPKTNMEEEVPKSGGSSNEQPHTGENNTYVPALLGMLLSGAVVGSIWRKKKYVLRR